MTSNKDKVILESSHIKQAILSHMLYRLHLNAAVTEYGGKGVDGIADCFGINSNDFTYEIEVKVSRSDLMSELNAIEYWLLSNTLTPIEIPKNINKSLKHKNYLNFSGIHYEWIKNSIPNYFCFATTEKFRDVANEKLKNTPYGLYIIFWHENGGYPYYEISCDKRPKKIHTNKASQEQKDYILHKACVEIQTLRSRLVGSPKDSTPLAPIEDYEDNQ